jgi:hypothetical protein
LHAAIIIGILVIGIGIDIVIGRVTYDAGRYACTAVPSG